MIESGTIRELLDAARAHLLENGAPEVAEHWQSTVDLELPGIAVVRENAVEIAVDGSPDEGFQAVTVVTLKPTALERRQVREAGGYECLPPEVDWSLE